MYDPKLQIGQILKNHDIVEIFKCGNMGGMRRSKATNTLVIITDYTKGLYHDKWIAGVLHYTGMGKHGDQDIHWAQNATLANYGHNDVDMHLFEVIDPGEYIYCGRIELVSKPYQDHQPDDEGHQRMVWMFPIRPVPENDVRKPAMFVFKDHEDYAARGRSVDAEYVKWMAANAQGKGTHIASPEAPAKPTVPPPPPQPVFAVPTDVVGKKIKHKTFGIGQINGISGANISVTFNRGMEMLLGYQFCINNKLIEFV